MENLSFKNRTIENDTIEFKKAKGGLPNSFFETYCSFLNSKGGTIYLGITELSNKTIVSSMLTIEEVEKLKIDLFNCLNNTQKVSVNLINSDDVTIKLFDGYPILEVKIYPAPNEYKPVYINNNILTGTYRRNNEGDYRCSQEEIKAMLRDSDGKGQDLYCLNSLSLDCLSKETINSYRNRLLSLKPNHVFAQENINNFLEYIGAIRLGNDNNFHPTRAGLLMFGYSHKIVYEFPEYFLDYQEHYSEDVNTRWTDRISSDTGDWSGNLFDFYTKVSTKIVSDLKIPFEMEGLTRIDETLLHKAFREALCNAICNSDFYQPQGLVIKKYIDQVVFSNPGCLKMPLEKILKGGESNARNKTILKMFSLIGIGERAGSGIPLIIRATKENNFDFPIIEDSYNPDRTTLTLKFKKCSTKPIKQVKDKYTKNELEVITYLSNNEKVKAIQIAKSTKLSVSTVKKILYKLVNNKLVLTEGTIKDKKYFLA